MRSTIACEGGGDTEKPRSAAIERASDIPPIRLRGFFPTQVVSLPIDIRTPRPIFNRVEAKAAENCRNFIACSE